MVSFFTEGGGKRFPDVGAVAKAMHQQETDVSFAN
jgi:hypothetical protein